MPLRSNLLFSKNNKKVDVFNKHNLFIGHSWHVYIIFHINLSTIESSISILYKHCQQARQLIDMYSIAETLGRLFHSKKCEIQQENDYKPFEDTSTCQ